MFYLWDRFLDFVNVLDEQYAYTDFHVACVQKMVGFDCNEWEFSLRRGLRVPVVFFSLEAIYLLRISSEQWGCNRRDWFSADLQFLKMKINIKCSLLLLALRARRQKEIILEVMCFVFRCSNDLQQVTSNSFC